MSFLNSLPLWGSLAALGVAVPIIVHLLSRKQKIETPWAAMELLKKALVVRSEKIQLEDYLLMVLRCLALFLIALALLRPVMSMSGSGNSVGVVIGIDASYSMNHGEHSRFEKAIGKAREILSTLSEGNPVSVILMSQKPEVLFSRTSYAPLLFEKILKEQTRATSHALNLERNLERLDELVTDLKAPSRECFIITDAQTRDWQVLSEQGRAILEKLTSKSRVVIVPVTPSGSANLAITKFAYEAGSLQSNASARFAATVRNAGIGTADGGMIEFLIDGKLKARQDVGTLEPGESRSVSFFTSFETAGDIGLTARLSKDELSDDNERYTVARVRSSVRVLCVDGDFTESTKGNVRGGYYVVRALRLRDIDDSSPIKVAHIDAPDLPAETLREYDLIVLVNVPDVTEELGKRLHRFVTSGGGLWVFLGDKVDAENYNECLTGSAHPVLPARLGRAITHDDPRVGWQIAPPGSAHPMSRLTAKLPGELTSSARFTAMFTTEPVAGTETVLSVGDGSMPLLLTHRGGRGKNVLLFTSSADRTWTNFPTHPLFAMLMQQSATMLTSHPELREFTLGGIATVPLPGRIVGDTVTIRNPAGESSPGKVTRLDGAIVSVIEPETPGIYAVEAEGGHSAVAIAANVDTAESDVSVLDAGALGKLTEAMGVVVTTDGLAESVANSRTGRDVSAALLAIGIICFIAQGVLANYFSSRQAAADSDVTSSLKSRRVAAARRS